MHSIYVLAYAFLLLPRIARTEIFNTCENITLSWELITFSQGNLLVSKELEAQTRTGTFILACDNVEVDNSVILSNVTITPYAAASVHFKIKQVDIYSEQNKCHLQYCLIEHSHEQCKNYRSCDFTLPVISLAANNTSERPLLLQWVPINEQTGYLILSNYTTDKQYQYEIFCDGFEVISETSSFDELPKVLLAVKENSGIVEEYQCLVRLCITKEHNNTCTNTSYYHVAIPDVINGRILQRPNVFYHHWEKPSSAVQLQVVGDQLNHCDGGKFYWLLDQAQLIVNYVPSTIMVNGKGNFTVECDSMRTVISDVVVQQSVETTLILSLEHFNNTLCSTSMCFIVNDSCIEVTKCDIKLRGLPNAVNDHLINVRSINNQSINIRSINNQSFLMTYCDQLKYQWIPKGLDHGSLIVTRQLEIGQQNQTDEFSLTCENVEVVDSTTEVVPVHPLLVDHNKVKVNFALRQVDIFKDQNCSVKICVTKQGQSCVYNLQCNFTLPTYSFYAYNEHLMFQWLPVDEDKGDLFLSNAMKDREHQYEMLCNGFEVENYTFALEKYDLKVSLLLNKNVSMVNQYQCVVQMCPNYTEHTCSTYRVVIPDIDATNKRILQRPNVFYRHLQMSNSTIELTTIVSCIVVKFYGLIRNGSQGELTVIYTPLVVETAKSIFKVNCQGATIIQPNVTDVLIQMHVAVTIKFEVENVSNNSMCTLKICHNKFSFELCVFYCDFYWLIPAEPTKAVPTILPDTVDNITDYIDNITDYIDNITEPCAPNTWLWILDSSEEGEAHFVVGNNIIDNVMSNATVKLSCANLTVISVNPQPLQFVLANGDVASFVVRTTQHTDTARFQECVFGACLAETTDNECEMIEKCYITIPLRHGAFVWSGQSHLAETCPLSVWEWMGSRSDGNLSIIYKTKKKERGFFSVLCTGIDVKGIDQINNTDVATFTLVNGITNNLSPPPYCNVRICVKQDQYIGCKKSLDCVLTIPSNQSRTARSYEEPSEELFQDCEQENSESGSTLCSSEMWDLFNTIGYAEGEASLRIRLEGDNQVDELVKASIYCSGLDIKGSTEYRLVIPKTQKETTVEFNISLPQPINEEAITYQCKVKTQRRLVSHTEQANNTMCPSTMSCSISVNTVLGRIVPKCNATEGKRSIQRLDVKNEYARVEITVSASPNNVYTVDPYCNKNNPFGHNTTAELLANTFPSTTAGEGHVTIAISFYPDCENKTAASYFMNKRLEDCHMDVYWYCQGGEQIIESIRNLQFADEPMYCEAQSIAKRLILSLEKTLGVYSEPIAILIAILIGVAGLYGLLIPASLITIYCHCKKYGLIPGTKIQCKHTGDNDSTDSLLLNEEMAMDVKPMSIPAPPPPPPLLSEGPQFSVTASPHSSSKPAPPPPPPLPPLTMSIPSSSPKPVPPPPPRSLVPPPIPVLPQRRESLINATRLISHLPLNHQTVTSPLHHQHSSSIRPKSPPPPPPKPTLSSSPVVTVPPPPPPPPPMDKPVNVTQPKENPATLLLPQLLIPFPLAQDSGSQSATSTVTHPPT